ncbi:MAG: RDD family protein [Gammaproteobacteria bacterium]
MIRTSEKILHKPCSLIRRLAAIFYDSLLLIAVLFAATIILLPFSEGKAIESENLLFFIYLSTCSYFFFVWQWTHGGQTLGMRTWKIKLFSMDSGPINWSVASKRFFLAMVSWLFAGAGFIWVIFDPDKYSFHDRYSGTMLYMTENNNVNG